MKVLIINGPNLNLVGKRQPELYGNISLNDFLVEMKDSFSGTELTYYQSNLEGAIISKLQEAEGAFEGVVLNAGGYSHTSVAIADAVAAISIPVIEVHITNIYAREKERQISLLSKHAVGCIVGLGLEGYALAVRSLNSSGQSNNDR